ncbi:MAG: hypothetical protein G3M70_07290 [Candidatus Nitronauta litoralis]|uniref:Uncharacterized protein n=1 Tax=Candidatus Nitronauta litoralis TaxID=2705533 RepID=A0A7T0FZU1_9BACT|nr:MAG: hypothetical protein G3M70_07290 [Candidatus Nitronauta litoralis]
MENKMIMTQRSGGVTIKKAKPKQDPPNEKPTERPYTRAELEKMSMKQLREIGTPLGAWDTSAKELIEEILVAQEKGKTNGS